MAGSFIFKLVGITLPAFKIAAFKIEGGIILGLIGLDMLQARRSPTKETPGDTEERIVPRRRDPQLSPPRRRFRMMGLQLTAIAVQFVLNGFRGTLA